MPGLSDLGIQVFKKIEIRGFRDPAPESDMKLQCSVMFVLICCLEICNQKNQGISIINMKYCKYHRILGLDLRKDDGIRRFIDCLKKVSPCMSETQIKR